MIGRTNPTPPSWMPHSSENSGILIPAPKIGLGLWSIFGRPRSRVLTSVLRGGKLRRHLSDGSGEACDRATRLDDDVSWLLWLHRSEHMRDHENSRQAKSAHQTKKIHYARTS